MNESAFTQAQLAWYEAYEAVRDRGKWNMFDPKARQATGLTSDEYSYVMRHFSELRAAHTKARK